MTAKESIISLVQLCSLCNAMPGRIERAANELGIRPAMRIDGRDHFTEADGQRILTHLKKAEKAKR
jgi:hypothetical protein